MLLNIVHSLQPLYRQGVVENKIGGKVIVPINYNSIIFQKYGIVAFKSDGTTDSFLYDGSPVLNGTNILFLTDNLMIVANPKTKKFYLVNTLTKEFACEYDFESILIFCGSDIQAIEYNLNTNLKDIFTNKDYSKLGAHIEKLVCLKRSGKWGVYNLEKHSLHSDFIHKAIVHCKGGNIGVRGRDNSVQMI